MQREPIFWIYMAKLNTFILSTVISAPTKIKCKCFHGNNGYENAPKGNVAIHCLSSSAYSSWKKKNRRKIDVDCKTKQLVLLPAKLVLIILHICFTIIITVSATHRTHGMPTVTLFNNVFNLTVDSNSSKLNLFNFVTMLYHT